MYFANPMEIRLKDHRLVLLPQKAIHFPDEKILVISDLHLGKINHFRRSGIPVPLKANDQNTETLIHLLGSLQPEQVIFLGDLFHSHYNDEWEVMGQVMRHYKTILFHLVQGNHDIMSDHQYERHGLKVHDKLKMNSIVFTHHPSEVEEGEFNLAGHVHPGVRLSGRGRQVVTLPCFYFGERSGLMPAFGAFTGLAAIPVKKEDRVFVITDGKIIQVGKGNEA
jgi:DNA ligase-associated metallophosphoesterase